MKQIVQERAGKRIVVMDSISHVSQEDAGHIVVSASHGGASSGDFASSQELGGVFFNDAGMGKDNAGRAALGTLEDVGVPAATVSYKSARIGDAWDTWEHGEVSWVNSVAERSGVSVGDSVQHAALKLMTRP